MAIGGLHEVGQLQPAHALIVEGGFGAFELGGPVGQLLVGAGAGVELANQLFLAGFQLTDFLFQGFVLLFLGEGGLALGRGGRRGSSYRRWNRSTDW